MLSPYRILDLTDGRCQLTGHVLAGLGAEVVAVEPPEGSDARRRGPFLDDDPGPERSLVHQAYNRGKRSVVLDVVGDDADREAFLRLVAGADVLIENTDPRDPLRSVLDPAALADINPSLVHVSISPFGRTGPKADWAASDLTVWASAGPLVMTGDEDRPPVQVGVPQAFHHAAAEAAGATIAALIERNASAIGQHLDVSAQQAATVATQSQILATPNNTEPTERSSGGVRVGPFHLQLRWPCQDGDVSVTFLFGTAIGPATARLMQWAFEEGCCDEAMRDTDWVGYGELLLGGQLTPADFDQAKAAVGRLCASKTKAELLDGALQRGLLIAPVLSTADVAGSEQFATRAAWDDVDGVRHPGRIAVFSATPPSALPRAPRLGEHTAAVLAEPDRTPAVAGTAERRTDEPAAGSGPLAGLKVLDFMWVMAGPTATRTLADMGATVVRVESSHRIETARTLQPFKDSANDIDSSAVFSNLNAGKLGLALDLTNAESREVVHDLVGWADVVTESFSPKAMRGFGLDYAALREIRPDIVMASSCLFGQTGPLAEFAGYGTMAAAMSGFFGITGWPDRPPCGPFGAYTDYTSPRFFAAAILAAVDHRQRTGEGQYIDFSQAEAALQTLIPALLDHTANGRVWGPQGNTDRFDEPCGVYPSSGDDQWTAIACCDDTQRSALGDLVGGLDDDTIGGWTSERTAADATAALQAVGVPSHPVSRSADAMADPQLAARNHFRTFEHPTVGELVVEGPRTVFSRTPCDVRSPGPIIGEHSEYVLKELLGHDDERFVELLLAGVLE